MLKLKKGSNIQILIKKKRFTLFEHGISIPFWRIIIRTKSRNEMTTRNNSIEWNDFRDRSIVP